MENANFLPYRSLIKPKTVRIKAMEMENDNMNTLPRELNIPPKQFAVITEGP